MSEQELAVQPKKKRGRPSNIEKFRQTLANPTFWENGKAPLYIVERVKKLDRNHDKNAFFIWQEWQTF
jgi:hypothetical protein